MALLFVDGFDHYATADLLKKWDAYDSVAPIIAATSGRRGGGCLQQSTNNAAVRKNLPAAKSVLIVGLAVTPMPGGSAISTLSPLITLGEGSILHVQLSVLPDGSLTVTRGSLPGTVIALTPPGVYRSGTWQYVEMKAVWGDTTGAIEIRVNGVTQAAVTSVDTNNGGTLGFTYMSLSRGAPLTGERLIDDLYIADSTGGVNSDFLGDVRVDAYFPTTDGSTVAWTPNSGLVHYTQVDEATPSATDYVEASTSGAVELFGFNDMANTPLAIFGVQVNTCALKTDAGTRTINNVAHISGTDHLSASAISLTDSAAYCRSIWDQSPATATAWTKAEIDAAEFGAKLA